jgi:hypothetical protein
MKMCNYIYKKLTEIKTKSNKRLKTKETGKMCNYIIWKCAAGQKLKLINEQKINIKLRKRNSTENKKRPVKKNSTQNKNCQ